jgi:8-oxo-dGTP diphosphatase
MSQDSIIVLGAAIIRDFRLFVVRRSQPPAMAGFWELPGTESTGDERGTLEELFKHEFGVSLNCVDQLLSDRLVLGWQTVDNPSVQAELRVWRCQFPSEATFDLDLGDPRPSGYRFDDAQWVSLDDLDAVSPWRDEVRISVGEVADYYSADVVWQSAD